MDEAFFRAAYDADAANKGRQTWEQYWGWVKAFYEGKRFPPVAGWHGREKDLAAKVRADARAVVLSKAAEVGRAIAAEWAKDNAVRKVGTNDLQGYGSQLEGAAKADDGSGARLLETLDVIAADVKRRVG